MKQKFIYDLHDTADNEERRVTLEEQGVKLSEKAWKNLGLGRPFYEVILECEVDEEGNVEILEIKEGE